MTWNGMFPYTKSKQMFSMIVEQECDRHMGQTLGIVEETRISCFLGFPSLDLWITALLVCQLSYTKEECT